MQFTTTTEIARKGSKIFSDFQEALVLSNNKPIWAILNYKMYEYLRKSWALDKAIKETQGEDGAYLLWLQENMKEWEDEEHADLFA